MALDDGFDNDGDVEGITTVSYLEEIMLKVSSNCFLSLTDDEYEDLMNSYDSEGLTAAQEGLVEDCLTGSPSGGAITGLAVADMETEAGF